MKMMTLRGQEAVLRLTFLWLLGGTFVFFTLVWIILMFQDMGLVHSAFRSYNGMYVTCIFVSLHGLTHVCMLPLCMNC